MNGINRIGAGSIGHGKTGTLRRHPAWHMTPPGRDDTELYSHRRTAGPARAYARNGSLDFDGVATANAPRLSSMAGQECMVGGIAGVHHVF